MRARVPSLCSARSAGPNAPRGSGRRGRRGGSLVVGGSCEGTTLLAGSTARGTSREEAEGARDEAAGAAPGRGRGSLSPHVAVAARRRAARLAGLAARTALRTTLLSAFAFGVLRTARPVVVVVVVVGSRHGQLRRLVLQRRAPARSRSSRCHPREEAGPSRGSARRSPARPPSRQEGSPRQVRKVLSLLVLAFPRSARRRAPFSSFAAALRTPSLTVNSCRVAARPAARARAALAARTSDRAAASSCRPVPLGSQVTLGERPRREQDASVRDASSSRHGSERQLSAERPPAPPCAARAA